MRTKWLWEVLILFKICDVKLEAIGNAAIYLARFDVTVDVDIVEGGQG